MKIAVNYIKRLFFGNQSKAAIWVGRWHACQGVQRGAACFRGPIRTRRVTIFLKKKLSDRSLERVTWRPSLVIYSPTHLIKDHHLYYFFFPLFGHMTRKEIIIDALRIWFRDGHMLITVICIVNELFLRDMIW